MGSSFNAVLRILLIGFNLVTDFLLEHLLSWYWGADLKRVTAPQSAEQAPILMKGAFELATLIREGKLKCYDVVKAYCERIEQVNQELNAVVDGPFKEQALKQAKIIDDGLSAGAYTRDDLNRLALLGVPFTTKDSTAVKGKLHTLGLLSRKDTRATEDAECVRLLKESGAIIIATSNIPEVNKWIETRNMLIGQTNNPYDLRRSAGGSSGGEAALVAACCTAFGLGTDIGGSIRIPAFNCGVFGHKPTMNVINVKGCTFRTGNEEQTMVGVGPIARKASDLLPIFRILIRPSKPIIREKLIVDEPVNLQSLRFFYIPNMDVPMCNQVTSETQSIMEKVRKHFESLTGREVQLACLPGSELANRLWRYWMTQEPADFNSLLGNGTTLNPYIEIIKKICGKSEYTMAAIYSLIDSILPAERKKLMKAVTKKCKEHLNELLGDDGVLFYHSSPRTAPFHYYPLFKFVDFSYFSIFNVLRVPVTQVPMGLDSKGLPLGLQLIANEYNDRYCFAVAEELERTFRGWVPPFPVKTQH